MENHIKIADKLIYSSAGKLELVFLDSINPINSANEKDEFYKSQDNYQQYEPCFKYTKEIDFSEQKKQINKAILMLKGTGLAEKILKKKAIQMLSEMELVENKNTKKFSNFSKKTYGKPSAKNIKLANEILSKPAGEENYELTAGELKSQLEERLFRASIDYPVILSEHMSAKASVHPADGRIKLNQNAKFGKGEAERLFVHEVETHIYRHLNGLIQPIKSLALGFGGEFLETEEGLAAFNETKANVSSPQQKRIYAGRLIAVDYALKHTFFETYEFLKTFFEDEEAYTITQRVKRGVMCAEKGAFTKDHCYFSGLIKLEKYAEDEKPIIDLYYGKVSTREAKFVKKLSNIKEPAYLPKWLDK